MRSAHFVGKATRDEAKSGRRDELTPEIAGARDELTPEIAGARDELTEYVIGHGTRIASRTCTSKTYAGILVYPYMYDM